MRDGYQPLRDAALGRASELLLELFPNGRVRGERFEVGNIRGDPGESLSFNLRTGQWQDWANGLRGSDYISLLKEANGLSYREAAAQLRDRLGLSRRGAKAKPDGEDEAIMPVPADAPPAPLTIGSRVPFTKGTLAASYPYFNSDGELLFYVARFDEAREVGKPKKHILPLSYFRIGGWRWKAARTDNTPLFGLPHLKQRPTSPVVIVEGEKTAIAAAMRFPRFVCVTWLGGASRLAKADLSPLAGRKVIYWRDADKAGEATVEVMIDLLTGVGAAELRVVSLPASLPPGWDVADAPPDGVNLDRLLANAELVDLDASRTFHRLDFEGLLERLVYNSGTEQFVDRITGLRRTRKQIDDIFAHRKGGPMGKRLIEDGRLPRTIDFAFRPNEPVLTQGEDGLLMYNLWKPSGLTPQAGDASPFVEHLRVLTTTDEEVEMVLNYAAFLVQHSGRKLMWALLLVGGQGTGKSLFGEVLRGLLGRRNTTMVTTIDLRSPFNDWIEAKLLVVVEEVMALGRREIINNLKPLVTQVKVPINQKHVRRYEIENSANFLLLSNNEDALTLDDDDRRFYVVMSDKPALPQAYFDKLAAWAEDNLEVILHYLLSRDLSGFNPNARPPMTSGKLRMIEASRPPLDAGVAQGLEERAAPFEYDLVVLRDLERQLRQSDSPLAGVEFNSTRLQMVLKRNGAMNLGQKAAKMKGVQVKLSLWALRDAERYAAMESSSLVRAYFDMRSRKPAANDEIPF